MEKTVQRQRSAQHREQEMDRIKRRILRRSRWGIESETAEFTMMGAETRCKSLYEIRIGSGEMMNRFNKLLFCTKSVGEFG